MRRRSFLGQVIAAMSRRTDPPLAEVRGVTRDDLAELDIVDTRGWSLDDLLADYPGWAERGMREADYRNGR